MTEDLPFVFSLFAGLLIAATVQLLLANLGIALGLTVLDWSPKSAPSETSQPQSEVTLPITHLLGLGVALSLSLVLFVASLLTTEFSQIAAPRRGAIFGIILWAAYWLLFVWLSSTTLSGIANSVLGTAIAGGRQLVTTVRQTLNSPQPNASELNQSILQDLAADVSWLADLQRQLPELLAHQRENLVEAIVERTGLSPNQAEAVVTELEPGAAKRTSLSSTTTSSGLLSQVELPTGQQLVRQLLNQVDFSNLDFETLWQQLQSLRKEYAAPESAPAENTISLDVEEYICHVPVWSLQPEVLATEFYQRIYDPEAAPDQIKEQLAILTRADLVDWLQQRGDLTPEQVEVVANHLRQVQQSVLDRVSSLQEPSDSDRSPALKIMKEKLLAYCRYTNLDVLTPDSLTEKVKTLRHELDLPGHVSLSFGGQIAIGALTDVLSRRQGLTSTKQQGLTVALVQALGDEEITEEDKRAWLERGYHRLEDYFQAVDWSTVSLEDLKPEVLNQLRSLNLKGELDWQALGSRLQVPDDLKADLIDWLQEIGQQLSRPPRRWAARTGQSTRSLVHYLKQQITQYLKFQDKDAFQPEQMAADLTHILKSAVGMLPDPSEWGKLPDLENLVDISALGTILETRRDMTAEQIQQVLGWFEAAWQQITRQAITWTQALWSEAQDLLTPGADSLDAARQQLVERIAEAQEALQSRAAQVKADLQNQADAARQQVAIAAWWLCLSLLVSAGAAMVAGWLAVRY